MNLIGEVWKLLPPAVLTWAAAAVGIGVLVVAAIQLSPSSLWRAVPRGDPRNVDVAVIMGFGYVQRPGGALEPGEANAFMFDWVRTQYPNATTILGQEGVVQAARTSPYGPSKTNGVRVLRMHAHKPGVDVNTLDAAVCAVLKLRELQASSGRRSVLIVSMPIHLFRSVRCFERAKAELYPELELVVPDMPAVPFPHRSVQRRTRSEFAFRFAEIIGRIRDLGLPFSRMRASCIAPADDAFDGGEPGSERASKGCEDQDERSGGDPMRVCLWRSAEAGGRAMRLWKPSVRRLAARRDVRGLVECLEDRDPKVRERAAIALGGLGHRIAVASLVAAMDDPEETVSVAAVAALGSLGDPAAVEPLCALLGTSDLRYFVAHAALEALGKIGGARALQGLTNKVATTGDELTSEVAVKALLAFPDDAPLSAFSLAVRHGGRVARELAAARLRERCGREDLDLLEPALGDSQPQTRVPAALHFLSHGDSRGIDALIALLANPPRDNGGFLDFHARARDTLLRLMSDDSALLSIDALQKLADLKDVKRKVMYYLEFDTHYDTGYDRATQDYASVRAAARQALQARGVVTVDSPA